MRLDAFLVDQGLARSRARAQELIAAGKVTVNGHLATKPATTVTETAAVVLLEADHPYVSRAALKLAALLDAPEVAVNIQGQIVLDVGASTGGFTQLMLARGAARVYAVDVGTGQLAPSLRNDPRILTFEQTDARHIIPEMFPDPPTILTADLSFISLTKVLPGLLGRLQSVQTVCALIKPQFELSPAQVGKGGLVKSSADQQAACDKVIASLTEGGFHICHIMSSPVTGSDGNQEYLVYATHI